MSSGQDGRDDGLVDEAGLRAALDQAPIAVLLFRSDERLTLVWRNRAHAVISGSVGRDVAGQGMFQAFPPTEEDGGAAAMDAIRDAVDRIRATGMPEEIGPYRFDILRTDGTYAEHHWQMRLSPVQRQDRLVAILQIAQDVTATVLSDRLSESLRRAAQSTAALSYFSFDPETGRFDRSTAVDEMFGFAPGEIGDDAGPFFDRVHPDDVGGVHAEVERVFAAPKGEIASFDYRVRIPDGSERFIRIRGEIATDPADRRPKLVGTFIDLTDIEENRRALERENAIRETLVAEANHRIKNSLAIALAMIRIEARALGSDDVSVGEARDALKNLEARVRAISSIHGLMQMGDRQTTVSLRSLMERIVEYTRDSASLGADDLVLQGVEDDLSLNSDEAVTLALILNELLTNALKYGIARAGPSDIRLSAGIGSDGVRITLSNAIVELRKDGAIPSSRLGSLLIRQLAPQIGAEIASRSDGATYTTTIHMPIPK
ncbi:sensor histidine kinase [Jannaschia rubra]|uniref:sensor histidine kinase n=1 Tax=Jannaschia rubra TaxID=282197 RepID=UPI00249024A6|nr:PAS domain S-box protein [Jannaschia rubra]